MVATWTSTHTSPKSALMSTRTTEFSMASWAATSMMLLIAEATRPVHTALHPIMVTSIVGVTTHAAAHARTIVYAAAKATLLKMLRLLLVRALLLGWVLVVVVVLRILVQDLLLELV